MPCEARYRSGPGTGTETKYATTDPTFVSVDGAAQTAKEGQGGDHGQGAEVLATHKVGIWES